MKRKVTEFWNTEPCGTRYLGDLADFEAHAQARYALEPYIPQFAGFASSRGLRVLEIGVGMGADYAQWLKGGALATGIDLSRESLDRAQRRCELAGLKTDLHVADAEHLPFPDRSFDVVYSYGVMHHSPDTARCLLHKPSARFASPVYRFAWKFFPRTLVRKLGDRWGLFLLVTGRKPLSAAPWREQVDVKDGSTHCTRAIGM